MGLDERNGSLAVVHQVEKSVIGAGCNDALATIQSLIEASQLQNAELRAEQALQSDCLSAYESGQLWRLQGYILSAQRKFPAAANAYSKASNAAELDIVTRSKSLYTLTQIYFLMQDYSEVITAVENGRDNGLLIDVEIESLLAKSLYRLDRNDEALAVLERLLENRHQLSESYQQLGSRFKESSLVQLWQMYYQQQAYDDALRVSRLLLSAYPKADYWRQVAMLCQSSPQPDNCNSSDAEWRLFISEMPR